MASFHLQKGEKYIRHCGARYYKRKMGHIGNLYLTNQRLAYYKKDRALWLVLFIIPTAAILLLLRDKFGYVFGIAYGVVMIAYLTFMNTWNGHSALDIPLNEITAFKTVTIRRKAMLNITRDDGTQYTFFVDKIKAWQTDIQDAKHLSKNVYE